MIRKATRKSLPVARQKYAKGGPIQSDAYFLSLSVENVRCFGGEKQILNFSDADGRPAHWTVILGNNGSGKTTLLECIAMFHASRSNFVYQNSAWYEPLGAVFGRAGFFEEWRRVDSKETISIRVELTLGCRLKDATAAGPKTAFEIGGTNGSTSWGGPLQIDKVFLPICYAYGAGRRMGESSLTDTSTVDSTANLFNEHSDLRNAEEWLLQLDYAAGKESEIQKKQRATLAQVRELLIRILPDVEDIRFSEPTKDRPKPGVEFKTLDGWVPLRTIGYGYRTAMAWMVDFASRMVERYPKSKDPLAEPAVVLVDEIDLHLHPTWQRTLMAFLSERFPNTQFIVTAHSPLFVQAAQDANLVVLRRKPEEGRVVIDNDVKAVAGWRVDQILTSDLFGVPSARPPQLDDLLGERKKLLTKAKLNSRDRVKLKKIEEKIGPLPTSPTSDTKETLDLLTKTTKALKTKRSRRRDSH